MRFSRARLPLAKRFPDNPYIQRLLAEAEQMGIRLAKSPVPEQWLYHPEHRIIYVWLPDLRGASLSYITMVLAHELGHARDFDRNPQHRETVRTLHWSAVPDHIERAAFIHGFLILQELRVPVDLEQYLAMIEEPMASQVREALKQRLCVLEGAAGGQAHAG